MSTIWQQGKIAHKMRIYYLLRLIKGGFNLRKWRTSDCDCRKKIGWQSLEQNNSDESELIYAKTLAFRFRQTATWLRY